MNSNNIVLDPIPNILNENDLENFKSFADMIQTGIILVDATDTTMPIVFVNNFFVHMTGYSKEESIGQNARFLQGEFSNQTPKDSLKKAFEDEIACEIELKNFKKDGTPFYNLVKVTPLFDSDGNINYYMGTQADITNSLEYRRINTIKRLAEGLTHEINTALCPIEGHIEILQYDIESIDDEDAKKYMLESLESIQKSKKIITDITNSLHYYCNNSKGTGEKVSLSNTIHTALDAYSEKIELNDICVELSLAKNVQIDAEKEAIIHLWMILLDNAIDALNENDTATEISSVVVKKISIKTTVVKNQVKIIFEDNASGIHPDIKEDIFKALTKNKDYGGLGIGLFVAKAIAENNNGEIFFSTSSCGTKFTVLLN